MYQDAKRGLERGSSVTSFGRPRRFTDFGRQEQALSMQGVPSLDGLRWVAGLIGFEQPSLDDLTGFLKPGAMCC